jgi:hypothetical protein
MQPIAADISSATRLERLLDRVVIATFCDVTDQPGCRFTRKDQTNSVGITSKTRSQKGTFQMKSFRLVAAERFYCLTKAYHFSQTVISQALCVICTILRNAIHAWTVFPPQTLTTVHDVVKDFRLATCRKVFLFSRQSQSRL